MEEKKKGYDFDLIVLLSFESKLCGSDEESGGTGGGDEGVEEVVDNGRKRKRADGGFFLEMEI